MSAEWNVIGLDTFGNEEYLVNGPFLTEVLALAAAAKKFQEIEQSQPSDDSGGQGEEGIQDRLFIEGPNGRYRFLPKELQEEL